MQKTEIFFSAEPAVAMADQPVAIRATGLRPGERIVIRARLRDDRSRHWESWGSYISDPSGCVSLTQQAPVAGSYAKANAMGLFWSMALDPARNGMPTPFVKRVLSPASIHLDLENSDRPTKTLCLERRFLPPDAQVRDIREQGLVGRLFIPGGGGKRSCVIVLGGSAGGLDWEKAGVLSSHGYATLALAYFGVSSLPRVLSELPLEYFATAISWLCRQPEIQRDRIGIMGMSKGGELALLLGANFPAIRAVAAVVPSAVVWPGFRKGPHSSWSFRGQPLPFVPTPTRSFKLHSLLRILAGQAIAFRALYEAALRDTCSVENAAIPVEKTRAPILLISGNDDRVWPSDVMSRMVMDRLSKNRFPFPFDHSCYESAGHNFRLPFAPATVVLTRHPSMPIDVLLGGTPSFHARAQQDSWKQVVQFFERHL